MIGIGDSCVGDSPRVYRRERTTELPARSHRRGLRWTFPLTIGLLKPLERPGVLGEALQVFVEYPLGLRVASGLDEYAPQILAYRNAPLRGLAVDELVLELHSLAKVTDRQGRVAPGLRDITREHLGSDIEDLTRRIELQPLRIETLVVAIRTQAGELGFRGGDRAVGRVRPSACVMPHGARVLQVRVRRLCLENLVPSFEAHSHLQVPGEMVLCERHARRAEHLRRNERRDFLGSRDRLLMTADHAGGECKEVVVVRVVAGDIHPDGGVLIADVAFVGMYRM